MTEKEESSSGVPGSSKLHSVWSVGDAVVIKTDHEQSRA
jgi:hypothetical protein